MFDTEDDSRELLAAGRSGLDKRVTQIAALAPDGRRFHNRGHREEFLRWLQEQRRRGVRRWFAHNLAYDLGNLFRDELDGLSGVMVGGRLISARRQGLLFQDSWNLLPVSVAKLGEQLGLKKLDFDARSRAYVFRDCEIVRAGLAKLESLSLRLGGPELPGTLGGLCVKLWQARGGRNEPDSTPERREAICGGRVELFRPSAEGPLAWTDINSLYPSVMLQDFPGPLTPCREVPEMGLVRATVEVPRQVLAPLPWRAPEGALPGVEAGALLFPCGKFSGLWTAAELRQAMDRHGVKLIRLTAAWGAKTSRPCYRDFMLEIYRRRIRVRTEADSLVLKLLMNNLYGQLGMKGLIYRFSDSERAKLRLLRGEVAGCLFGRAIAYECALPLPEHVNYVHAAHVTAFGRMRLLEFLRAVPADDLLYCDTDSIFFRAGATLPFPVGHGLGAMKLVARGRGFEAVGPKLYRWQDEAGAWSAKAKGVPRRLAEQFMAQHQASYDAPYKLREAIRFYDAPAARRRPLSVWRRVTKELRAGYRKKN
ncbi:MAG: DNA polymerase, partial [Terriglobales bacterium]